MSFDQDDRESTYHPRQIQRSNSFEQRSRTMLQNNLAFFITNIGLSPKSTNKKSTIYCPHLISQSRTDCPTLTSKDMCLIIQMFSNTSLNWKIVKLLCTGFPSNHHPYYVFFGVRTFASRFSRTKFPSRYRSDHDRDRISKFRVQETSRRRRRRWPDFPLSFS